MAGRVQLQHMWLEGLKGHHTQLPEQQAHGTAELTRSSVLGSQLRAALQPLLAGRHTCRACDTMTNFKPLPTEYNT